ncbi:MAG TPA: hypothetical protein VI756_15020 [Blastocatellia bacterium]
MTMRVILGINNPGLVQPLSLLAQTSDVREVPVVGSKDVWFCGTRELMTTMNAIGRMPGYIQLGLDPLKAAAKVAIELATSTQDVQDIPGLGYLILTMPEGNGLALAQWFLSVVRKGQTVEVKRDLPEVWFPTLEKFYAFPAVLQRITHHPEEAVREALEFKLL